MITYHLQHGTPNDFLTWLLLNDTVRYEVLTAVSTQDTVFWDWCVGWHKSTNVSNKSTASILRTELKLEATGCSKTVHFYLTMWSQTPQESVLKQYFTYIFCLSHPTWSNYWNDINRRTQNQYLVMVQKNSLPYFSSGTSTSLMSWLMTCMDHGIC
jgi:hemolysin-activating ACP:hemolysin acyltransferase